MKKVISVTILLLLLLCGCVKQDVEIEHVSTGVQLENPDGSKIVLKTWMDEENDQYVFLPSYCELSDVSLLNEVQNVIQSANVATLFVNTESGSMDAIHGDKNYRESAEVTLYTKDGVLDYRAAKCSLKGRGNTTWDLFEKKPYQLKLEEAADLLGMGEGKKWILLANAFDETNLRNKFIYDLSRENEFCYAPECEFVDLYLNGEYRGLYLLCERVEFGEDRLALDTEESYMCNVELGDRWDTLDNAFLSDAGRAIEIREPDQPTEDDVMEIKQTVNQMEAAIMNADVEEQLDEIIDVDSWVFKYLIDEIMENGDADIASSYFYYADGKIFAGPLWDYDNTLGVSTRNQNPRTFLAKSGYAYSDHGTPYYDALNAKTIFYDRMVELYTTKMLPALQKKMKTEFLEEEAWIANAAAMNHIRWKSQFESQNSEIKNVQGIIDYLKVRIEFLNSAWIHGETYYTVQFEPYVLDMYATPESHAGSYVVKPGKYFSEYAVLEEAAEENAVWIDCETGEVFDPEQAITKNMTLILKRE